MSDFYEVYKMLVSYELYNKDGAPHLTVLSTNPGTQKNPAAVSFDYQSVWDREDNHHDVAGFYHTHPSGMNNMSQTDIETMTQWVNCLGKSLVCIIETEQQLNGWYFSKSDIGKVTWKEILVATTNNLAYDVWMEPQQEVFFNPVDFIMDGDFDDDMNDEPDFFQSFEDRMKAMEEKVDAVLDSSKVVSDSQSEIVTKFNKLLDVLKGLINKLPKVNL